MPRDWLLLLLALEDLRPLDPVRLQKGMFLLAEESGIDVGERYVFRAYDYGPFSSQIYQDIESLVDERLVEPLAAPGYKWNRYVVTDQGLTRARALVENMSEREIQIARWLAETKVDVLSKSFGELLSYVYERHPAYSVNSVFSA
jgi:uncharacterized protein YwgA